MERQITCINCPVGCRMTVVLEDGVPVSVSGNTCKRGENYAKQECVSPERMVTAVVPVSGSAAPLSVKTRRAIPKAKISQCMQEIAALELTAPIAAGTAVITGVCGTDVDVIATRSV